MGAAEGLIADVGVQAVSMNAIARRAGISPGSLYQYFSGRNTLLEELSRRLVTQLQCTTQQVPCTGSRSIPPTPEITVDRLLNAVMLLAQEHPALPALLAATEPTEPHTFLRAISRSLPRVGPLHNEDVTRDLATRIFCTDISLAVQQPDPAVLLLPIRQAVLSVLRATENPQHSASPPMTSQAGPTASPRN
nr:TetR/AcrR family transcriptional regulator [Streptomyces sp. TLI_105]